MKNRMFVLLVLLLAFLSASTTLADNTGGFVFAVDTVSVSDGFWLPAVSVIPPANCVLYNYQTAWELLKKDPSTGSMVVDNPSRGPLPVGFSLLGPGQSQRHGPFNQWGVQPGVYLLRMNYSAYPNPERNANCPAAPQNVQVSFTVGGVAALATPAPAELVGKVPVAWNGHIRGRVLNFTAYVPTSSTATFIQTSQEGVVVKATTKLEAQLSPFRNLWFVPDSFDISKPISIYIESSEGIAAAYDLTSPDPAVGLLVPHGIDK